MLKFYKKFVSRHYRSFFRARSRLLSQHLLKSRKSETIIEVLIALLVVSMGAATATSLIITSIQSNVYNKDTLAAMNLAMEGIETVRNFRDTNWLKFSYDSKNCWNIRPDQTECNKKITADFYALGYELGDEIKTDLDLKDGNPSNNDQFQLKYFDVNIDPNDPKADSNGDGDKTNDKDFVGSNYVGATEVGSTKFYRSIGITYTDLSGNGADENTGEVMKVTSKIEWFAQGIPRKITLTSNLTNYRQ